MKRKISLIIAVITLAVSLFFLFKSEDSGYVRNAYVGRDWYPEKVSAAEYYISWNSGKRAAFRSRERHKSTFSGHSFNPSNVPNLLFSNLLWALFLAVPSAIIFYVARKRPVADGKPALDDQSS